MEYLETLSSNDLAEINGGFVITTSLLVGAAIGAAIGVVLTQDLDDLGDAFMEGYNAARD